MKFKQNNLEHLQSRLLVIKAKQLPHGQFEAILSTSDLDRHGEYVSVKGMVIPKDRVFKMYYNHQTYGDSMPIGKWLKVWKSGDVLMGQGEIDLEDGLAVKVYKKILGGFIDSVSVGFYPREFDGETSTWTKSELVEASVVAEPANVSAVITSKDILGYTQEEFTKSLKVRLKQAGLDTEDKQEPATATVTTGVGTDGTTYSFTVNSKDGAVDSEVKSAIDELKSRVGALEATRNESNANPATNLIRVRVAAKQAGKAAEELNRVIKVKLKETSSV